jgi:predicted ATPase
MISYTNVVFVAVVDPLRRLLADEWKTVPVVIAGDKLPARAAEWFSVDLIEDSLIAVQGVSQDREYTLTLTYQRMDSGVDSIRGLKALADRVERAKRLLWDNRSTASWYDLRVIRVDYQTESDEENYLAATLELAVRVNEVTG